VEYYHAIRFPCNVWSTEIEGGTVVAINLPDLPRAVRDYLDNKVIVTIDLKQDVSQVLNPGEPCYILVSVKNASAANGGIALANVRYQVSVANPDVVKFFVPPLSRGTTIDGQGHPIAADALVGFFTFDPTDADQSYLRIGEATSIRFNGRTGPNSAGGSTSITARIQADPDINALFPRNENSSAGITNVTIVG
jgi:hypothetical protein